MAAEILTVDQLLANTAEPLRAFRWILSIQGIDAYTCKSTSVPGGTFGETTVEFVNSIRYLAGKFKPSEMALTLWDPIAPAASQKINEWVKLAFDVQTGRAGYSDIYKKDFELKLLDPPGGVARKWQIKGGWIKSVDYGKLDYSAEGTVDIALSIRYDSAILLF